ncbi:LysR substrate-binding domain-containing protein [Sandaracinobacter sp. RS1-74]|uniref:LysR substrate-binding domain-containing protein n=1 Tax=Sandaracinobacteroides sayramensis TaxID=2913411 RepID=UPI001EDA654A|nr:LysR substrate-binding domain-containing protein [Sandaracinobacteroides sayramensis]MCG2842230.1 LysR substrate-binding domain-containing protein [Sandaracinobacteroides sayramensis]
MELRHIRYFLAVAEEGNFTRAAARVGIGQPPLSLQIRDLETEIGAQLFHRVPHGAELTEAGRAFLEVARLIPVSAADAVRAAQRAARGETGQLTLGFTGTAALNPIVPASIRAFRRRFPDVEMKLEETNSVALIGGLLDGRLDLAILRPAASDPHEIVVRQLAEEPLLAVLPASHPAAQGAGDLDLAALAHDPLILTPRSLGVSLHDSALQACRAAGFEPLLGQPAPQIASILSLVSAELGFSLLPASIGQLNVNGVAYRRIGAPSPRVSLVAAYRRAMPPKLATNFAAIARTTARQMLQNPPRSPASVSGR